MRNSKIQLKQEKLLNEFLNNESLSVAQIMELLECNRQSVYNYIKRLEKNGCKFIKQNKNNNVYYTIVLDDKIEESMYKPMTLDILRKYTIVKYLQEYNIYKEGPIRKEEVYKQFTPYKSSDGCTRGGIPIDVGISKYYELISELIEEGEIEVKDDCYYLIGKNIPSKMMLTYNDLRKLYDKLKNTVKGSPYYEQLKNMYYRIGILLGEIDTDMPYFNNYIVYGKRMDGLEGAKKYLDKIRKYDYRHKILKITRMTNNKKSVVLFAVGKVVYNSEKDVLYLIGKEYRCKKDGFKHKYDIIKMETVIDIEETEMENDAYDDIYFKEQFKYMFSISVEKTVDVKIEFDNVLNIKRKVENLKNNRVFSKIQVDDMTNKIIYTDKVSGLPDFAKYLRRFGKNVRVIEPATLKNMLKNSVDVTLDRYEEENQDAK